MAEGDLDNAIANRPHDAELPLKAAANLTGYSSKTLRRDRDAGKLELRNRDGSLYVTVQALVDAGWYAPDVVRPAELEELAQLRVQIQDFRAERARLRTLQTEHADYVNTPGVTPIEPDRVALGAWRK